MKNKKISVIKNNFYFLQLLWEICPIRVILNFVDALLSVVVWAFFSIAFIQFLFEASENGRNFKEIMLFIWVTIISTIIISIFSCWYKNCFVPNTDINIHQKLNLYLFDKVKTLDISCYEKPEFYNTYTKAMVESSERAKSVLENCSNAVSSFIISIFIVGIMCSITPWSIVFIVLPVVGNLWFGKKLGKTIYTINQEETPAKRRIEYVNRVMYLKKYSGELRMTEIFHVLTDIFRNAKDEVVKVNKKHATKKFVYYIAKSLLMVVLGFEGMWLCAALLAIYGSISMSQLMILVNAIVTVSWILNDFESSLSKLFADSYFIQNFKEFLEYTPQINEKASGIKFPEQVDCIELRNVSFSYPGQDGWAIDNVNIVLKRGIKYLLVGVNGSGKTTLIKLIMRFYDPQKGEILLNGVNIREYDIEMYRQKIGVAFQDFALFATTIQENVLLREANKDGDNELTVDALKMSGLNEKISCLKKREKTIVTREFDLEGVEFSGGEKQKIGLARAFARKSQIIILDEPTSALDPIAEYNMFETMRILCDADKKLSIIVSHRLSSSALCDEIIVLEKGKIREKGSHVELLQKKGLYAKMFYKQANNYLVEDIIDDKE